MNEIIKQTKKQATKAREVRKMVNLPVHLVTINQLTSIAILEKRFIMRHDLNYEGYLLLLMLCDNWLKNGGGMTSYQASKLVNPAYNNKRSCTATFVKLTRLLNKGLIEVVGVGRYGSNVYAPSLAALNELHAMCVTG